MVRFLICSFALVLLYPAGIDMYLVGLPEIASGLNASESQLHIAFSLYLVGMALAMFFAGKGADRSGRRPVAIAGALIFIFASALCGLAQSGTVFMAGRFVQGVGAGCCYVVSYAIMRDVLEDRRREKVLSLLNGIICIVPVLAPVLGYLLMRSFPWQSLFYLMAGMGALVLMLSVFILRETRHQQSASRMSETPVAESLTARFFISRVVVTTLSISVILTFVNTSPVLLMEYMRFERSGYATIMALTSVISMAVSFTTPFALSFLKPRTLMMFSQLLFLTAGIVLAMSATDAMVLVGLSLICVGFPLGFGVAVSQALGPFSRRAGVASSVLGIAQVCGSSLWISASAVAGFSSLNMLTGALVGCGIISLLLIIIFPHNRSLPDNEQVDYQPQS
ncbi:MULTISPECIES: MFS transporter [unclassified Enterobacter]|uniref:MFS transporter n=1 Tax=unclassified Enterobacter TaxID=2608935 RepID=UPI000F4875D3|nr:MULTISPECIES: MFS transporter [unclassified Enterobacter]